MLDEGLHERGCSAFVLEVTIVTPQNQDSPLSLPLPFPPATLVALPSFVVLVSSLRDDVVRNDTAESFTGSAVLSLQLANFTRERESEGGGGMCTSDALGCALILLVNGRDLGETLLAHWGGYVLCQTHFQAPE